MMIIQIKVSKEIADNYEKIDDDLAIVDFKEDPKSWLDGSEIVIKREEGVD